MVTLSFRSFGSACSSKGEMVKLRAWAGAGPLPGAAWRGLRWAQRPAPAPRDERAVHAARALQSAPGESGGQGWSRCHDNPGGRGPRASGLLPGGRRRGGRGRPLSGAWLPRGSVGARCASPSPGAANEERASKRAGAVAPAAAGRPALPGAAPARSAAAAHAGARGSWPRRLRQDRGSGSRESAGSPPSPASSTLRPLLSQPVLAPSLPGKLAEKVLDSPCAS